MMTWVLAGFVDATLVLALGLIAMLALRRRSAALRHATLTMALVMAALMPAFEWLVPQVPIGLWRNAATAVSSGMRFTSDTVPAGSVAAATEPSGWRSVSWLAVFVAIWMAGAILASARLIVDFVRLARLKRRCRPVAGRLRDLTDTIAREYGIRRHVALLESDGPSLLVTCGVFAPSIIVPAGSPGWTDERSRIVLRHELAHVERHDAAIQIGAELLRIVQWVNPLIWLTCRRLRQESEQACDDAVLSGGVDATDYATQLLDVAKALTGRSIATAHAIANPSTLERRIAAMLHHQRNRAPVGRRGWFVSALAAIGVSISVAAVGVAPQNRVVDVLGQPPGVSLPATSPVIVSTAVPPSAPARVEPAVNRLQTGAIAGAVLDPSGASLPGAEVTLTDMQASTALTSRTNASGAFGFRDLPPSRYELVVRLPGFAPVSNVLTVASGDVWRRTITLPLGSLQETIVIVCGASPAGPFGRLLHSIAGGAFPVLHAQEPTARRVGGEIRPPRKTKDVKPTCPVVAPAVEATVRLSGRIGIDGLMNDVKRAPSEGGTEPPNEFTEAAIEAVRQWTFTPTLLNGQPVDVAINIMVTFRQR
jgi:beta-lactamase regulating signal transducer with metallopeptidase domain